MKSVWVSKCRTTMPSLAGDFYTRHHMTMEKLIENDTCQRIKRTMTHTVSQQSPLRPRTTAPPERSPASYGPVARPCTIHSPISLYQCFPCTTVYSKCLSGNVDRPNRSQRRFFGMRGKEYDLPRLGWNADRALRWLQATFR